MEIRNYTVKRGTTWQGLQVTIIRNGSPLSLSGASIAFIMKRRGAMRSDTPTLSLSSPSSGITITNANGGSFAIQPVKINASAGLYDWECDVTLADGETQTWLGGTFTMEDDLG